MTMPMPSCAPGYTFIAGRGCVYYGGRPAAQAATRVTLTRFDRYMVKPGDTTSSIARMFGLSNAQLVGANRGKAYRWMNGVVVFASLAAGERLNIPMSARAWVTSSARARMLGAPSYGIDVRRQPSPPSPKPVPWDVAQIVKSIQQSKTGYIQVSTGAGSWWFIRLSHNPIDLKIGDFVGGMPASCVPIEASRNNSPWIPALLCVPGGPNAGVPFGAAPLVQLYVRDSNTLKYVAQGAGLSLVTLLSGLGAVRPLGLGIDSPFDCTSDQTYDYTTGTCVSSGGGGGSGNQVCVLPQVPDGNGNCVTPADPCGQGEILGPGGSCVAITPTCASDEHLDQGVCVKNVGGGGGGGGGGGTTPPNPNPPGGNTDTNKPVTPPASSSSTALIVGGVVLAALAIAAVAASSSQSAAA